MASIASRTAVIRNIACTSVVLWGLGLAACGDDSADAPVNAAPTLTSVAALPGGVITWPRTITHAELLAASDAFDAEGDPISFRLAAISGGILTQDGTPVAGGGLLTNASAAWVWTPDSHGVGVAAFTVVAHDGTADSSPPVQVQVDTREPLPILPHWLGAYGVTDGWRSTGVPTGGVGDGMLNQPRGVLVVGGYLFVTDSQNHRVQKFDIATGDLVGWVGGIERAPTGGAAGCGAATPGSATPGWCLGGTSAEGTAAGHLYQPLGIAAAGGVLYVGDAGNKRIVKYDLATGAYLGLFGVSAYPLAMITDENYLYVITNTRLERWDLATETLLGWTGRAATAPSACDAAGPLDVPGATRGWCQGGTSETGNLEGEVSFTAGVAVVSGKIYIAERFRIQRFDAATGTTEAWLGTVGGTTPALGGDCAGQAVGYVAQGWCTGGTTGYSNGYDGDVGELHGLAISGDKMYVASQRVRVTKYDVPTGSFEGWVGKSSFTPSACQLGVPAERFKTTGSWCVGGRGEAGWDNGMFDMPYGVAAANGEVYIADGNNGRVARIEATTGAPLDWLGASPEALTTWSATDTGSVYGFGDGMVGGASRAVVNATNDLLYVVSDHRISKFVASTGEFLGWTGRTATMPESCEGSLPAVVPGPTGGWCKGGEPVSGGNDGELRLTSSGLHLANGYLYVSGYQGRLMRFETNGAYAGWIGTIGSTINIAPQACADAGAGAFTPTWCTGGWADSYGTEFLGRPAGIVAVGTKLYVVDDTNHRVARIDVAADVVTWEGWTGRVGPNAGDVPTACDGGKTPGPGEATGDWCYGGTSQYGSGDGMFREPSGLTVDGNGTLFVGEYFNSRVVKIGADGAFAGAVTVTSRNRGIYYDRSTGLLYVANTMGNRIDRYDGISGQFMGWAGAISSAPTQGDYGCSTAAVGQFTPGWCLDGVAGYGSANGYLSPQDVFVAAGWVFVVDRDDNDWPLVRRAHHRVVSFPTVQQ